MPACIQLTYILLFGLWPKSMSFFRLQERVARFYDSLFLLVLLFTSSPLLLVLLLLPALACRRGCPHSPGLAGPKLCQFKFKMSEPDPWQMECHEICHFKCANIDLIWCQIESQKYVNSMSDFTADRMSDAMSINMANRKSEIRWNQCVRDNAR